MTTQEKFVGFTYDEHANYYHQAVEKYGQAVMDEAASRQAGQEEHATEAFNQVFRNLAKNLQQGLKVDAVENQVQAANLLQAIRTYAFDCSLEVFAFIGKGYVANLEFKKNIDQFGVGTAQYAADVIQAYVHK
jgi:methyltransferase-like protein